MQIYVNQNTEGNHKQNIRAKNTMQLWDCRTKVQDKVVDMDPNGSKVLERYVESIISETRSSKGECRTDVQSINLKATDG